jgi:outer membrane protein assembly factor BamB
MKTCSARLPSLVVVSLLLAVPLPAENWPHWRGPNFNGSSSERGLPAEFSRTNNVKWSAAMPGPAASSPIVWGDRIFTSSTDERSKTLVALCLDRATGKLLWQQEVSPGIGWGDSSNYASPSPVTDGKMAVFLYGNGEVAAFEAGGKKLWSRNLQHDYGEFAYQWTYGASPTLFQDKLYIQVLQRNVPIHGRGKSDGPNDSYLLALDPKTGKELWKHVRPSDAPQESLEAYSTPIPFEASGRKELLVVGGDCITGHDPANGKELWRWGTWNTERSSSWRLVPSPVFGGGVILACAPKGAPIYALKAGGQGTLDNSSVAWKSAEREVSSDVATPLFYKGRFYVLNGERKTIARIEPATGKPDWIGELGSKPKIESSPTGADDKIYFQDFRGDVFVVAAADTFKLLHVAHMGDDGDNQLRSTITVAQGNLFIRTGRKLYCIGSK